MDRLIRASAFAMILLGLTATQTRAASLVITGGNVVHGPGGTGTMDLTITSDSSETLSQFSFELVITPLAGTTSLLQFTTTQSDPYGNPNYVFQGESLGAGLSSPFWSPPFTTNSASDSILGGDMDNGAGPTPSFVTLPGTAGGAHSFLGTVQFQVPGTAAIGDRFQISLVPGPNTDFSDQNGNALTLRSNLVGTVTVSVVPEPSAFLLMAISSVSGLLYFGRGRGKGKLRRSPSAGVLSILG